MTPDTDRLREEAEVASGFGTSEQVDRKPWAGTLRVGDVIRVEPHPDEIETFTAPIRGFSEDKRWTGEPLVRGYDVPVGPDEWDAVIEEDEYAGVVG